MTIVFSIYRTCDHPEWFNGQLKEDDRKYLQKVLDQDNIVHHLELIHDQKKIRESCSDRIDRAWFILLINSMKGNDADIKLTNEDEKVNIERDVTIERGDFCLADVVDKHIIVWGCL